MSASPSVRIKICGLTRPADVEAAVEAGANWVGFVFFDKSPRHVSIDAARRLADVAGDHASCVGLFVDPDPSLVAAARAAIPGLILQFHGREPDAALQVQGAEVWKALPVAEPSDLGATHAYPSAHRFLFDAKPPKGADRPGGWGEAFDWSILSGARIDRPWLLAGGLHPGNVAEAIAATGARAVDVSTGVEAAPGLKDTRKIRDFIDAARSAG